MKERKERKLKGICKWGQIKGNCKRIRTNKSNCERIRADKRNERKLKE